MIKKKLNTDYLGGSPNIPVSGHDDYYAHDLLRDHNFLRDQIGHAVLNLNSAITKIIVSGGIVSHVAGEKEINVTAFIGYAPFNIPVVDSWFSMPPTITAANIDLVEILSDAISAFDLTLDPGFVADGTTPNYIKIKYGEDVVSSSQRNRVHGSGNYYAEKKPIARLTVNTTAPSEYEICLGQLTCTSDGNTMTITNAARDYDFQIDKKTQIFTESGTWRLPPGFTSATLKIKTIAQGGNGGNGGGGGGGGTGYRGSGGGGGGAGETKETIIFVSGDKTITINSSVTSFDSDLIANVGQNGNPGALMSGSEALGGDGGNGGSNGGGGGGYCEPAENGMVGADGGSYYNNGSPKTAYIGNPGGHTIGPVAFTGGNGGAGGGSPNYGSGGGGGGAGYRSDGGAGGDGGSKNNSGQAGNDATGYGAGGGGGGGAGAALGNGTAGGAGGAGGAGLCIVDILDMD